MVSWHAAVVAMRIYIYIYIIFIFTGCQMPSPLSLSALAFYHLSCKAKMLWLQSLRPISPSIMWTTTNLYMPNFNNKCCVSCLVSDKIELFFGDKNWSSVPVMFQLRTREQWAKSLSRSCPNHIKPFRPLSTVKLLRIMLRNRWCRSTTFHIITAWDVDGWCHKWLVWSTPHTLATPGWPGPTIRWLGLGEPLVHLP